MSSDVSACVAINTAILMKRSRPFKVMVSAITLMAFFNESIIYGAKRHKLFGRIKSRLNKLFSIIWRDYFNRVVASITIAAFLGTVIPADIAFADPHYDNLQPELRTTKDSFKPKFYVGYAVAKAQDIASKIDRIKPRSLEDIAILLADSTEFDKIKFKENKDEKTGALSEILIDLVKDDEQKPDVVLRYCLDEYKQTPKGFIPAAYWMPDQDYPSQQLSRQLIFSHGLQRKLVSSLKALPVPRDDKLAAAEQPAAPPTTKGETGPEALPTLSVSFLYDMPIIGRTPIAAVLAEILAWAHEIFHWIFDLGRGKIEIVRDDKGRAIGGRYISGEKPFRHSLLTAYAGPICMLLVPLFVPLLVGGFLGILTFLGTFGIDLPFADILRISIVQGGIMLPLTFFFFASGLEDIKSKDPRSDWNQARRFKESADLLVIRAFEDASLRLMELFDFDRNSGMQIKGKAAYKLAGYKVDAVIDNSIQSPIEISEDGRQMRINTEKMGFNFYSMRKMESTECFIAMLMYHVTYAVSMQIDRANGRPTNIEKASAAGMKAMNHYIDYLIDKRNIPQEVFAARRLDREVLYIQYYHETFEGLNDMCDWKTFRGKIVRDAFARRHNPIKKLKELLAETVERERRGETIDVLSKARIELAIMLKETEEPLALAAEPVRELWTSPAAAPDQIETRPGEALEVGLKEALGLAIALKKGAESAVARNNILKKSLGDIRTPARKLIVVMGVPKLKDTADAAKANREIRGARSRIKDSLSSMGFAASEIIYYGVDDNPEVTKANFERAHAAAVKKTAGETPVFYYVPSGIRQEAERITQSNNIINDALEDGRMPNILVRFAVAHYLQDFIENEADAALQRDAIDRVIELLASFSAISSQDEEGLRSNLRYIFNNDFKLKMQPFKDLEDYITSMAACGVSA